MCIFKIAFQSVQIISVDSNVHHFAFLLYFKNDKNDFFQSDFPVASTHEIHSRNREKFPDHFTFECF